MYRQQIVRIGSLLPLLTSTVLHAQSTNYLDVINYNDLIYNVDVGFDDLSPDFYQSVRRDQVQFGESLEGLDAQYLAVGDIIQGAPTVPLTITEGISKESLVITDSLGPTNNKSL